MPRRESALIFRKSVMSEALSRDYQKVFEFLFGTLDVHERRALKGAVSTFVT